MTSPRVCTVLAGCLTGLVFASYAASAQVAGGTVSKKPPAAKPRPASPKAKAAQTAPPLRLPRPIVAPDTNSRPHAPVLPPGEFMPVDQIKGGMKGYGLSVFQGNKIERFDVTILGVMRKVNNGRDLILVKLGGPKMQRVTDVIAGMSGSPVYVNGKIVGAVSYGSQFTRESIGYLTPIEDMLDAWDPALPQSPYTPAAPPAKAALLPAPLHLNGHTFTHVALAHNLARPSAFGSGTLVLRPLTAKVTVSGVSSSRWESVRATLQGMGLDARQGPGGVGGTRTSGLTGSALTPGGAIAMSLATGDIDITAIGTLTYRRKNQIVAFGHPFLNIGPLDAPMSTAYIHDIEPSFAESSKIGSPVSLVGSFSQDRPFSVAGRIGAKPTLVPITVRVQDKAFGRDRVFHAQLVRHPQITPQLIPLAANTAISEVHGQPGDAMATVTTTVTADEVGTITRTNRVYDGSSIDSAATSDLMSLMSLLSANPFYPVAVRSVTMSVAIEPGRKTAQVERIYLNQSRYEPGETVEVGVVLKPYKLPRVIKTLRVTIPPSTPSGVLTLVVGGGGSGGGGGASASMLGILLGGRGAGPDYSSAANVKQLVQKYKERDRNDALVVHLQLPTSAISISGEKMPDLPANLESVLRGGSSGGFGGISGSSGSLPRSSGVRLERDEVKVVYPTDYVLSGSQALPIRVARKNVPAPPPFGGGGSISAFPPPAGGSIGTPPPSGTNGGGGTTITILPPGSGDPDDGEPLVALSRSASGLIAPPSQPPSSNTNSGPKAVSNGGGGAAPSAAALPGAAGGPASGTTDNAKPVNRQPGVWRQTSAADFRTGLKLDGVTVTGAGDVRLAPRLTKTADTSEPYFWCLASDAAGGVYAGSGDNGAIYHVQNGKADVFSTTGEIEVFSLVRTKSGVLYAGTAPNGRVFRIGADGKAVLVWEPAVADKEKYALALALSPDEKTLYVGLGGPSARIVSLPVGDSLAAPLPAQTRYQSDETNVTALAVSLSGDLYAGTAPGGLVIHVSGPSVSRPAVVYDAAETTISGLAIDAASGDVFASTMGPRSVLYRITPGAGVRALSDKIPTGAVLSNLQIAGETLYAGSGATIYAVSTNGETVQSFDAPSDIQILSLLVGENGRVWASTGSTGGVYALQSGSPDAAAKGEYLSAVLDAKATAKWGTLRWTAQISPGASLQFQTRSGDTFDPDTSWSDWSRSYTQSGGETIASPPARYLQYRAVLTGSGNTGDTGPQIKTVEAFYLPPNQAPQVALSSPRGGEVWKGQNPLRWAGNDPDKDTLLFDVSLSGDGGKTWTPVKPAPPVSTTVGRQPALTLRVSAPPPSLPAPSATAAGDIAAELVRHPEISPELRNRILADAPPLPNGGGGTPTRSDTSTTAASAAAATTGDTAFTRETTVSLDTTRFADGTYLLRVRATDKASNPDGALTDEKISGEFRIVNHAPLLVLFNRVTTVQPDKTVHLEGVASHPLAAIRAVQFRVDGGEWMAARASDGIFDGVTEPFTVATAPLLPGTHTIEVQTQDEAGNAATQKTTVTVR